ncbi:hypothetical protein [Pararhizobium sp. A13]|uniref:hypothetical protein n=1 Tax=Pararhizobium sp. A13 TaxID=3133975 RepID=UPI0032467568
MENSDINELQRSLGRIEGKTDALLINQDRLREDYDTLKQDVVSLRFKLNWYAGALATAGSIAVLFKDRILHLIAG